jgi:hypothetical protein
MQRGQKRDTSKPLYSDESHLIQFQRVRIAIPLVQSSVFVVVSPAIGAHKFRVTQD